MSRGRGRVDPNPQEKQAKVNKPAASITRGRNRSNPGQVEKKTKEVDRKQTTTSASRGRGL